MGSLKDATQRDLVLGGDDQQDRETGAEQFGISLVDRLTERPPYQLHRRSRVPAKTRTGYGMRKVTVAITPITASPVQARVAIQRSGEGASARRIKRSAGSLGVEAATISVIGFHCAEATGMSGTLSGCRRAGSR